MSRFAIRVVIGSLVFSAAPGQTAPPSAHSQETAVSASAMPMGDHLPASLADWSKGARLYEGLGTYHRRITTRSPDAQRYFCLLYTSDAADDLRV